MTCACTGCINKRMYYLWLKDTVEEFGMKIPRSLQFDPWTTSNTKLDSAINRMIKLYQKAFRTKFGGDPIQTELDLTSWGLSPYDVKLKQ